MSRVILPIKYSNEVKSTAFDLISQLAVGESLSSATVTCTVFSGIDSSPSALISGSATVSGAIATQVITGGVTGVTYNLTCTAVTSAAQTLALQAYLTIAPSTV